jgi:hypothetical protein
MSQMPSGWSGSPPGGVPSAINWVNVGCCGSVQHLSSNVESAPPSIYEVVNTQEYGLVHLKASTAQIDVKVRWAVIRGLKRGVGGVGG